MELDLTNTLFVLSLILLLVIGGYSVVHGGHDRIVRKRGDQAQSRIVNDILDTAIDQRAVFRIEILGQDITGHRIEGACTGHNDRFIRIETAGLSISQGLRGERVQVLFQTTYRRKASFFQFYSHVLDVEQAANVRIIHIARPESINPGQKRSFFRLTPAADAVLGLGIWPLGVMPIPNTITQLPPAHLRFRPDKNDPIALADISAGGMRLSLHRDAALPALIGKDSALLCLLRLKTHDEELPLTFWFVARVVLYVQEHETKHFLTLRFTSWATTAPGQRQLVWFPFIKSEGIAPLSAWITRHHFEQSKNL